MSVNANQAEATEELAKFIAQTRYEDLPEELIANGKMCILDGLSVALAGAVTNNCRIIQGYLTSILSVSGRGVPVIGTDIKLPPSLAALANGTAVHADDFDDTLPSTNRQGYQGSVHPTAPILSAVFSAAHRANCDGRTLITAYHVGVETAARVNRAIGPRHFSAGFHPTGTCGAIGATAGVANILQLDVPTVRIALGIASSRASGLRGNFGTMTKPLHAGQAAETGVISADLAAVGLTSAPSLLDGSHGLMQAYGDGGDSSELTVGLGVNWSMLDPGILLKPYPSGMRTHPPMLKLAEHLKESPIEPNELRQVRVRTHAGVFDTLRHHRPRSALEAKFSLEFCLAAIIISGGAGLSEFTDKYVMSADVQKMIRRIDYRPFEDGEAEPGGYTDLTTIIDLELSNGEIISLRADGAKVRPNMSYSDVISKARATAGGRGWPSSQIESLANAVADLENLERVIELTPHLSGQRNPVDA